MTIGSQRQENFFQQSRIGNFFVVGNGIALSVSNSSSAVQFPTLADGSPATDIMIVNDGTVSAFFTLGSSSPTAVIPTGTAANGVCIRAGATMVLDKALLNWAAAITASGTTTLYFYQGYGS